MSVSWADEQPGNPTTGLSSPASHGPVSDVRHRASDTIDQVDGQSGVLPGQWPDVRSGELVPAQETTPAVSGTGRQPALRSDSALFGGQLFALVDASNPDVISHWGVDTGTGAVTVHRDPETGRTDFGSWISMESAYKRLGQIAGPQHPLALVMYDSLPTTALAPLLGDQRGIEIDLRKQMTTSDVLAIAQAHDRDDA